MPSLPATPGTARAPMNDFQAILLIVLFAAGLYGLVYGCAALGVKS